MYAYYIETSGVFQCKIGEIISVSEHKSNIKPVAQASTYYGIGNDIRWELFDGKVTTVKNVKLIKLPKDFKLPI
jgi:hypothetical protein